jgi:4-hydroxy-tetrahydrodipicolinate reductase
VIRLLINGARGRMGTRIAALAGDDHRFTILAGIDRDDPSPEALACDLVIDFSSDAGARRAADLAARFRAALLVGTTALSAKTLQILDETAQKVPVMVVPNTSLGMAALHHLAAEAARLLGREFDVSIIDIHHAAKRDAPSGTALRLAETLRQSGAELPPEHVHSIRAGDVIGEHTIEFFSQGERLRLTHAATDRDLFARGALRAGAWLTTAPPGRYTIEDSLGLTR